jgi:VWFA-related protein
MELRVAARRTGSVLLLCLSTTGIVGSDGENARTPQSGSAPRQVIRRTVNLVEVDAVVRDAQGRFVPDLKQSEFDVFEDGVKQEVVSFLLSHGGRVYTEVGVPTASAREGIVLPPVRPPRDVSSRIFLIFVDDLHLDPRQTPRVRELFNQIAKTLVHDGDLFGVVSTGPSAIEIELTYDRKRLDEARQKIMGGGLRPSELIQAPQGAQGPAEMRHRAHVAFSTANDILTRLAAVHNRRKAFIYISNGYDFNPFPKGRAEYWNETHAIPGEAADPFARQGNEFSEADLVMDLAELTRTANRANVSIYTIDPRGLPAGPDIDERVDSTDWHANIRTTQDTLRVLAEQTGGIAAVNRNDLERALKQIDNATSDYYVLGYYSSNPDQLKRTRRIEVRVKRPGLDVEHRREYALPRPSA